MRSLKLFKSYLKNTNLFYICYLICLVFFLYVINIMQHTTVSIFPEIDPSRFAIDIQELAARDLATMTEDELDTHWKLNEFFGSIYVINLPQAKERLSSITDALKAIGVHDFKILEATDGRKEVPENIWKKMYRNWAKIDVSTIGGQERLDSQHQAETGCYISHLKILQEVNKKFKQALLDLKKAYSSNDHEKIQRAIIQIKENCSVLILEDDTGFGIVDESRLTSTLKKTGIIFRKAMQECPKDWEMLYLMGWAKEPSIRISPRIKQLVRGSNANGYAVSYRMYDILCKHLEKIDDAKETKVNPVDDEIGLLHRTHRCYGIDPSIAYQREGTSSITLLKKDYLRQSQS